MDYSPIDRLANKQQNKYVPIDRLAGLQSKPSFGEKVIGFGKEILKDPLKAIVVQPAAQLTAEATKFFAPNSLAAKGYEEMAKTGETQKFNNIPIISKLLGGIEVPQMKPLGGGGGEQALGEILHAGSYGIPYGKVASTISAAAHGAPAITTGAAIRGANLFGEAASGSLGGAAFGAGQAMEEGGTAKDVLKSTAIGAGLGGVAPLAFAGIGRFLKRTPKITPEVTETATKATPEGFTAVKPEIKTEVPLKTTEIPRVEPISTKPTAEINPVVKQDPEIQASIDRIVKETEQNPFEGEVFESTTMKQRLEKISSQTPEHVDAVIKGTEKPMQGTTYADYWRIAAETASKQGDAQKILDLGLSMPKQTEQSLAGKKLGAFGMIDRENPASIISDILKTKTEKLPSRIIKSQSSEVESIASNIRNIFDNIKDKIPTKEDILSALDKIKCK